MVLLSADTAYYMTTPCDSVRFVGRAFETEGSKLDFISASTALVELTLELAAETENGLRLDRSKVSAGVAAGLYSSPR